MTRLSPILTTADLPAAELGALRLDGELVALDDAYTSIDQPHGVEARALSLARYCDERLIVEQLSAAWVWGALARPPLRHQLCASLGARSRSVHPIRLVVREVVITDADQVAVSGVQVTTPLRTAVDLLRFSDTHDGPLVDRLLALGGVSRDDCAQHLHDRPNLPRKRLALERLALSRS